MNETIYLVVGSISDREGTEPVIFGAFTKESLANKLKMVAGFGAKVVPVQMNYLHSGSQ